MIDEDRPSPRLDIFSLLRPNPAFRETIANPLEIDCIQPQAGLVIRVERSNSVPWGLKRAWPGASTEYFISVKYCLTIAV